MARSAPRSAQVKWCKKGEYLISLGVPHGWNFNASDFYMSIYTKCKLQMAHWHDVERMSPHGSAMVGNAMVYSKFRYWASCLYMDPRISDALDSDVQALIWGKEVWFDPDSLGSERVRRYMLAGAQYLPRRAGGIGLLHWQAHLRALAAVWLFHYNAAGDVPYKHLLDQWFGRFQEGRGAVFSTIPVAALTAPIGTRRSALPRFFKFALRSLRSLTMSPVKPGAYTCLDETRAEPLFTSHRIKLSNTSRGDNWRHELTLNRVQDLINPHRHEVYSDASIRRYVRGAFTIEDGSVVFKDGRDLSGYPIRTYVPIERFVTQWHSFVTDAQAEIASPCR